MQTHMCIYKAKYSAQTDALREWTAVDAAVTQSWCQRKVHAYKSSACNHVGKRVITDKDTSQLCAWAN